MRTVILGNSGSGKTWLARKLTGCFSIPIIHFDDIFWEPGGFDKPREFGHSQIYKKFSKKEFRLKSEDEVLRFIQDPTCHST